MSAEIQFIAASNDESCLTCRYSFVTNKLPHCIHHRGAIPLRRNDGLSGLSKRRCLQYCRDSYVVVSACSDGRGGPE